MDFKELLCIITRSKYRSSCVGILGNISLRIVILDILEHVADRC